ncbi:MAG: TetR/AcrR family transcriptional regulator [Acidimicrobiaceae bacterium]
MSKSSSRKKTKVKKRAKRKAPDLQDVVEKTIVLLEQQGLVGFRIEDLIKQTGISKSSLYLHFGDRDGLLSVALESAFFRDVRLNIDAAIAIFAYVKTKKQMHQAIPTLVDTVLYLRKDARWQRIMVLSMARHQPGLLKRVSDSQVMINNALEEIISDKQKLGLIRNDLSAREIGIVVQAALFGRIFRDFDSTITDADLERWRQVLISVYESFLA